MNLCRFSYSGTSPATVVAFHVNPNMGDWSDERKWRSPRISAAGKQDSFVYDKAVVQDVHILRWAQLPITDMTALALFLEAVDGISNAFDYTDPAGNYWTAQILNAASLRMALASFNRYDISVELLIKKNLITNGLLWSGASGFTPPDAWNITETTWLGISGEYLTIQRVSAQKSGIYQHITTINGHNYTLTLFVYVGPSGFPNAAIIDVGNKGAEGAEYGSETSVSLTRESKSIMFTATSTDLYVTLSLFRGSGTPTAYFSSVVLIDTGA